MNQTIITIISNPEGVYEGDLKHYFKVVFNAPNAQVPYHNFRHMMHITCQTYDAIKYYGDFERRRARALLIAALFHDYGHKGVVGNDSENIAVALSAIRHYVLDRDKDLLPEIEGLISVTEFPHKDCDATRSVQILRDADMTPAFDDVWIQEVVFGLSKEFGIDALSFLRQELEFIPSVKFSTTWAMEKFSQRKNERLTEIETIVSFLQ